MIDKVKIARKPLGRPSKKICPTIDDTLNKVAFVIMQNPPPKKWGYLKNK